MDRNLIPLTDEEKLVVVPEMAHRAALLFALVRFKMIRAPLTNDERKVWDELAVIFPEHLQPPD